MGTNLIRNGDFSQGYGTHDAHRYTIDGTLEHIQAPEITNPKEWTTFFVHGLPVPWDDDNPVGFAQPEVRLTTAVPDPNRVMEGTTHSLQGFGFYKIIDCGHFQRVAVTPGKTYRLTGYAHAWSSNDDNPSTSEGVGNAAYYSGDDNDITPEEANHGFAFGVSTDGSTDIQAAIWNPVVHIYNQFHEVPALEFTAVAGEIVVFIRDTVLWPYKHNDYYWSDISLVGLDEEPVSPSPEPPQEYDYPVIENGTKLGDHSIGDNGMINAIYDRMQRGVFTPIAKSVASIGVLEAVKLMSPDTITIGRLTEGIDNDIDEEGPPLDGDLQETASKVMNSFMPLWEPHKRYVDFWEVVNEQDPLGPEGHARLGQFYIHCMDIAEANGYKLAILSYSLGVPEYDEMQALVKTGVFARAKKGGHILSLHEYASPTNKWYGQPIPGTEQRDDAGPLCTRYRFLYSLLEEEGQVIPLVVTEFNTTESVKSYTAEDWIANMAWYDERLSEDYYVLGATIFTLATGIWEGFRYIDYIKPLEDYMVSVVDRENALPPSEPGEQPVIECPKPRIPYERTYVLIPPPYGFDWISSLGDVWDLFRFGIGGSADDSAYGPGLAKRTVLALNPDEWPGDLGAFIDEYYEGAELHCVYADDPEDFAMQLWMYYSGEDELLLSYPTTHMPPVVTSWFGDTAGRIYPHNGIDFRSSWSLWQDQIVCSISGVVKKVAVSAGYGNHIITTSKVGGKTVEVRYAHLTYDGAYVGEGDLVARGQYIGRPDNTGNSTGDHLHFDVKIDGVQVDPAIYIDWPDGQPPPGGGSEFGNLRGAHAAPTTVQSEAASNIVNKLQLLGLKWFKILTDGNPSNIELCSSLIRAGIMPIVRLYTHEQFPDPLGAGLIDHASHLVDVGVKYFEIGNEPNLPNEWESTYKNAVDFNSDDIIRMCAKTWCNDAKRILAVGGCPSIYAMAPTDVNGVNPKYSSVNWLSRLCCEIAEIWDGDIKKLLENGNIWLAVHSAAFTRPFNFDPFSNMDDMCLRNYELYQSIARAHFEVINIVTISTEGGIFSPEQMDYIGWTDYTYDELTWGHEVVNMYHFLEGRGNLTAMCPWTFSDIGVSDPNWIGAGWYRQNNEPRSPVVALLEDVE